MLGSRLKIVVRFTEASILNKQKAHLLS